MSKSEIQYLLTFAAGIAVFWLSGQVSIHLGIAQAIGGTLGGILNLLITIAIYGLGLAILTWFTYGARRTGKAILTAALTAVVLAAISAQVLLHGAAHLVHSNQQVGYFTFVAFLLYGLIYVGSAALGRRML